MDKKIVVRLDKIASRYFGGGHIYSVISNEEMQNGYFGHVGELKEGEREIFDFKKPTTESIKSEPAVIIFNPEVNYSEYTQSDNNLACFSTSADTSSRAYDLTRGDIISVSKEGIDAISSKDGAKKGNYLVLQNNSYKLKEVKELTGDEVFVAKVIDRETMGTTTVVGSSGTLGNVTDFVVMRIIKNL